MPKTCTKCKQQLPIILLETRLKGLKYHLIQGLDSPYYIVSNGKVYSEKRDIFLKMTNRRVMLPINGVQKSFKVERLMLDNFNLNTSNSLQPIIIHIDGDTNNFNISNIKTV